MNENRVVKFINRIATGTALKRWLLTGLAPLIFSSFIIVFILLAYLTDDLLRLPWPFAGNVSLIAGLMLITCGSILIAWCVFRFLQARGTPVPFNPPKSVVTRGPYRYCRNPMISGLFVLICGTGFLMHSISLLVFYLPLFILLNYLELKHIEEPELEKRFGKSYVEYKNMTPMFIPRLRRQK